MVPPRLRSGGFLLRVTFLVDGFNVYHSAAQLSEDCKGASSTKWLDLSSMMRSLLPLVDKSARLEEIHYFSALAHHMERSRPGTVARHENYIKCLRASGVRVEMGRFKSKPVRCRQCHQESERYEEKETDVAIAVQLIELFARDLCDTSSQT